MIVGVLLATCIGCSSTLAPPPPMIPPSAPPIEHVQAPSKLDVQREMNYRALKDALDKAQKALDRYDRMSTWGP
ncbi:MAG TPA: hypothetical protein VGR40_12805 [Candidatus Binatus sp.]|nr:hypothetical protein [Candidatus Binatus sp.]